MVMYGDSCRCSLKLFVVRFDSLFTPVKMHAAHREDCGDLTQYQCLRLSILNAFSQAVPLEEFK